MQSSPSFTNNAVRPPPIYNNNNNNQYDRTRSVELDHRCSSTIHFTASLLDWIALLDWWMVDYFSCTNLSTISYGNLRTNNGTCMQ